MKLTFGNAILNNARVPFISSSKSLQLEKGTVGLSAFDLLGVLELPSVGDGAASLVGPWCIRNVGP